MLEQTPHPVAARMAGIMLDRRAATGACTEDDLLGTFRPAELATHANAARRLAAARYNRPADSRPIWETDCAWREGRVSAGAEIALTCDSDGQVVTELLQGGYRPSEITALFDEIVEAAARLVERRAAGHALRLRAMTFRGVPAKACPAGTEQL